MISSQLVKSSIYIDSRLEVLWIPEISGRGVFARQSIQAGTVVETAPVVVYPEQIMAMAIWLLQAEGMKSSDFVLDQYTAKWFEDGVALPLGWTAVYNHSDRNNCQFLADRESRTISILTLRDVAAGEQCTVSYGADWFAQKGYVKKVDF